MSIILKSEPILNQTVGYNVSDRYNVIPTAEVIQEFTKFGFELGSIQSAGVRSLEKALKQRHLVRMRREEKLFDGELVPEVAIYNSYDGTKALEIHIAVFRFICENGIISGTYDFEPLKILHSNNNWMELVHEYIDTYSQKLDKQKEVIEHMKDYYMSLDEAYQLAEESLAIRHYDGRIINEAVDPLELLVAKRREDKGDRMWNRFNILQESLVNGYYKKYDNDGSIRKAKIMTNVDEIIRFNKELSNIFEGRLAA
jgi:hypothetical protein